MNFIGGHDVNANLGIRKKLYKGVIGPFGIDNRNMKGRRLLSVLSQNRLRVTNSYFKKSSFVTWRSFNASRYPHMLDVITTSDLFFKHVRDCGVTSTGTRSDHSAVRLTLSKISFMFYSTYVERPVIDWKRIQYCEETKQLFNVNLQRMLKKNMIYTLFNEAILNSAQQSAMTNRQSNKGWLHHSKGTLSFGGDRLGFLHKEVGNHSIRSAFAMKL